MPIVSRRTGPLILVLVVAVTLLSTPTSAQHDSPPAPYLFYFDTDGSAWVIERADGTDRRTLGEGLGPDNASRILGPGWSPSGNWFAWTAADWRWNSRAGDQPFLVSADGSQRAAILDEFADAVMAWSPTEDVLLVAGTDGTESDAGTSMVDLRILLLEPTTMTIRTDVTRAVYGHEQWQEGGGSNRYFPYIIPKVTWTHDGNHAIVSLCASEIFDGEAALYSFLTFTATGESLPEHACGGNAVAIPGWIGLPTVSANGDVLLAEPSELVRVNLVDGSETHYAHDRGTVRFVLWNPRGDYGLVQIDNDSLWLLDTAAGSFAPVFDPLGYTLVVPDISQPIQLWSPDGLHALFPDAEGQLVDLDATTGAVTMLGVVLDHPVSVEVGLYAWHWLDATHVEITTAQRDADKNIGVYRYTVGDTVELIAEEHFEYLYVPPSISPDGTQFAEVAETITIRNIVTGTQITLPPDSRSYFSAWWGETAWHTSSDWLLLYEDALVAGGGFFRWTGVASADGTVRREFGRCADTVELCVGWLPPQVDPAALPPVDPTPPPQPVDTFTAGHWSWNISWSPDGTRLAAGGTHLANPHFTAWDIATHTEISTFDGQESRYAIEWTQDMAGDWTPNIIVPDAATASLIATSPDRSLVAQGDRPAAVYEVGCPPLSSSWDISTIRQQVTFRRTGAIWWWAIYGVIHACGIPSHGPSWQNYHDLARQHSARMDRRLR